MAVKQQQSQLTKLKQQLADIGAERADRQQQLEQASSLVAESERAESELKQQIKQAEAAIAIAEKEAAFDADCKRKLELADRANELVSDLAGVYREIAKLIETTQPAGIGCHSPASNLQSTRLPAFERLPGEHKLSLKFVNVR